jgi:plastocyanin
MSNLHSRSSLLLLGGLVVAWACPASAEPARGSKPATQADIERLEKKIEDQQKLIDSLVELQRQYLEALNAVFAGAGSSPVAGAGRSKPAAFEVSRPPPPRPVEQHAAATSSSRKPKRSEKPDKPEKPAGFGVVVGKVAGVDDAVIYVDDIVSPAGGSASVKQEGKQFMPKVLVVTKGMTVGFPNLDAFFHNVFSVSPGNTFDLGSYRQGETRTVKMSKTGVVTVYCNMHPQMVGHILVVPNGHYVRAGKDGFFRLANVPAGTRRLVAWAPNAKPMSVSANVVDGEVVTIELALKKGRTMPHTRKDGLPYGSYDQ